jgi:uncharacterized membrane protein
MASDGVFIFVGTYPDTESAEADYDLLKDLHSSGAVGTYDAAVIDKTAKSKVHVHKHEKPTQHGAWSGLAVGGLLGILFPPGIIVSGILGAAVGGLIGHLWRGMSRGDLKELGEALDEGEAALVVIGESRLEEVLNKELKKAARTYEKQVDADAAELRRELDKAIDEAKI